MHRFNRLSRLAIAGAAALACATSAPQPAAATPDFDAPFREILTGNDANSIAPGDYDGDGLLDVLVAVTSPDPALVLMRQNPDHTFSYAATWGPPTSLYQLVPGDFNGDGYLDVAGTNDSAELEVRFGEGNGVSSTYQTQALASWPHSIARANLNGPADGDDLVVMSYYGSVVETIVGADGDLDVVTTYATLANPAGLGVGDLDNDGFDDIVMGHEGLAVASLLYTDGTGAVTGFLALGNSPTYAGSAAVKDVDGDLDNDILVGATDGTGVAVYLCQGLATYSTPVYYGGGYSSIVFSLHGGDLDGDGDPDFVMGGGSANLLINSGSGTFTSPLEPALPSGTHGSYGLNLVDYDGDGVLDLMGVGNYGATLLVARGNGDATFGNDLRLDVVRADDSLLVDVDGDGDRDFVAVNGADWTLSVLRRTGTTFGAPEEYGTADLPWGLASGDFDDDGHPDLAVALAGTGDVAVFLNDGLGNFPAQFLAATGERPTDVVAGDVDGDGVDDLVAICISGGESKAAAAGGRAPAPARPASAASTDGLAVLLSLGGGSFSLPDFIATPSACPTSATIADANDDGTVDIVASMACLDAVQIFPGLGGGAFGVPSSLAVSSGPGPVAVHDLDGDTIPDIVVATSSGWLHTIPGLGSGSFGLNDDVRTNYGINHLVVRDLDADGLLDAAALSFASVVAVHAGTGGGHFGAHQGFGTFTGTSGLLSDDLDGDGAPDLLVSSWNNPALQFLRNRQGGGSSAVGDGPLFATGVLDVRHPAPNPASGGTQLEFRLGSAQRVAVDLYDLRGRLVRSLVAGRDLGEGSHVLHWDLTDGEGARVPSGVYLARVRAGEASATRKVFVTR